jgi:hypothetical protein
MMRDRCHAFIVHDSIKAAHIPQMRVRILRCVHCCSCPLCCMTTPLTPHRRQVGFFPPLGCHRPTVPSSYAARSRTGTCPPTTTYLAGRQPSDNLRVQAPSILSTNKSNCHQSHFPSPTASLHVFVGNFGLRPRQDLSLPCFPQSLQVLQQ